MTPLLAYAAAAFAGTVVYQGPALESPQVQVAVVAGPPQRCLEAFLDQVGASELLWLGDAWAGGGSAAFQRWVAAREARVWLIPGASEARIDRRRRSWRGGQGSRLRSWSRTTWRTELRTLGVAALDGWLRGPPALEQEYWSGAGLRDDGAELVVAVAGPTPPWLQTDSRPFGTDLHLATRLVLRRDGMGVTLPDGPWGPLVVDLGAASESPWAALLTLDEQQLEVEAWACDQRLARWVEDGAGWRPTGDEDEPAEADGAGLR